MKNLSPNEETIENGQQKVEWKKEMKKKKKKERKKEHGGGRVKVLWGNKNNFFFLSMQSVARVVLLTCMS